jgi:hypothetical protein
MQTKSFQIFEEHRMGVVLCLKQGMVAEYVLGATTSSTEEMCAGAWSNN